MTAPGATAPRESDSGAAAGSAPAATPMMAQYIEIKAANPDCLLFYRMGDFYELFFEDAEIASRALGIALTRRGQHLGKDIPMCGVPVKAADDYLQRLIRLGHRVAVCDQMEDPAEARKRGAKAVVRRDVTRLVTAGTLTEDSLLDARSANHLAAVAQLRAAREDEPAFAVAWLDMSTGGFRVAPATAQSLEADLARIDPGELVLSEMLYGDDALKSVWRALTCAVTPLPRGEFDSAAAERRLKEFFGIAALDAFGSFSRAEVAAAGAVIAYVELTQFGNRPKVLPLTREDAGSVMEIDPATRASLEITRTQRGERDGSLLWAIDRTVTAAGARELAARIASPLTDPNEINARLDMAGFFADAERLRGDVREELARSGDLARSISRLSLGRGGPRDLAAIRDGLDTARTLARLVGKAGGLTLRPALVEAALSGLAAPDEDLGRRLAAALAPDLPLQARDGGFVAQGFRADLDEARALRDESRKVIAGLQARHAQETGVKALKVRHNNVLGYFVEVPQAHGATLMAAGSFIHRQTMANAMRFTTVELGELEAKIAAAADRALAIELEVFEELRGLVMTDADALHQAAHALAALDVAAALADLAVTEKYCRPAVDASLAFSVTGGRHPVVERALKKTGEPFVANDCDLGDGGGDGDNRKGAIWLVTGPNMAGKSTFLRQNALIALMAQAGSYVPAKAARLGVVDRLFSRVGASDDLARGRSTFMVEMVETAAILNRAGERSLVILDEIGRGTATFDGLSIAWAALEHLHEVNGARTLFATHFHELANLAKRLPRIVNTSMTVKEWDGEVVFLHEVAPGAADRSYGIQVARIAGLPGSVVARARAVLAMLEEGEAARAGARLIDELPLFSATPPPRTRAANPREDEALALMAETAPDELTPREALDLLYRLKHILAGN